MNLARQAVVLAIQPDHCAPGIQSMPSATPPASAQSKNLRAAVMLNLFLPGAGQLYLGQRVRGYVLMGLFAASFAGVLGVFLVDYAKYLKLVLGGDIFQGNHLEQVSHVFQVGWLLGLLGVGLAVYVGALISLKSPPKAPSPPPLPPRPSDRPKQL
jgi:TM2 domain-containing membrane protein YozV